MFNDVTIIYSQSIVKAWHAVYPLNNCSIKLNSYGEKTFRYSKKNLSLRRFKNILWKGITIMRNSYHEKKRAHSSQRELLSSVQGERAPHADGFDAPDFTR